MRVVNRASLERFREEWRFHNPLEPSQLEYADQLTTVVAVGFYHGGDALYTLQAVLGVWHEACLESASGDDDV